MSFALVCQYQSDGVVLGRIFLPSKSDLVTAMVDSICLGASESKVCRDKRRDSKKSGSDRKLIVER